MDTSSEIISLTWSKSPAGQKGPFCVGLLIERTCSFGAGGKGAEVKAPV